jgi:hypothetical protein
MQQEIEQYFLTFCLPVCVLSRRSKRFLRSPQPSIYDRIKKGNWINESELQTFVNTYLRFQCSIGNFITRSMCVCECVCACVVVEISGHTRIVGTSLLSSSRQYISTMFVAYDLLDVKLCDFLYSQLFYCHVLWHMRCDTNFLRHIFIFLSKANN